MAVSEEGRHELYLALEQAIGRQPATTMMELLPPVGWADVATRRDLERLELSLRSELHTEIAGLRDELHTGIAGLRDELHTEIAGLRDELHTGIVGLRGEIGADRASTHGEFGALRAQIDGLRTEMDSLRNELLAAFFDRLTSAVVSQTRLVIAAMLTYFIAVIGLVLGLVR